MRNSLSRRLAGVSRRTLVMAVMALMVPVTALASASPAMAEPKGIFKVFKECPTEIPGLAQCTYDQTTEGEFVIGTTRVPITGSGQTITLQGGNIKTGNPENRANTSRCRQRTASPKPNSTYQADLSDFIDCTKISEPLLRAACLNSSLKENC